MIASDHLLRNHPHANYKWNALIINSLAHLSKGLSQTRFVRYHLSGKHSQVILYNSCPADHNVTAPGPFIGHGAHRARYLYELKCEIVVAN